MPYSHLIRSLQRGVEFMLVKRVEEIGFTVAGQVKPTNDGYKTITLSSGEVGESLNTFFVLPIICYSSCLKIALFFWCVKSPNIIPK